MSKIKNLSIYNKTAEQFATLKEEYEAIGFSTELLSDRLVIFALHPKKAVAKKVNKKDDRRPATSREQSSKGARADA